MNAATARRNASCLSSCFTLHAGYHPECGKTHSPCKPDIRSSRQLRQNLLSENPENEVVPALSAQDEIPFFLQELETTAEAEMKSDTLKFRIGQPNN